MRPLLFALALALAACGGGGTTKPVEPEPAPTTTCFTAAQNVGAVMDDDPHKDDVVRVVDEACTTDGWSAATIACFSDARSGNALRACDQDMTEAHRDALLDRMAAIYASPDDAPEPTSSDAELAFYESTGAAECDELVQRTLCMYRKTPSYPQDAFDAFRDGVAAWRQALDTSGEVRLATIDACKMSVDAGKEGFEAIGCTADVHYTGHPICDELITKTRCMWDQQGAAVSADMKQMLNDAIPAWREALASEVVHQATVDACTMSVDAGRDGFAAVGC